MRFNMVGDDGNAPRGNFPTYYADGFTDRCRGHHPIYYWIFNERLLHYFNII